MALLSNALTSVAKLKRYMKTGLREVDFLRIYHDGTGVTSATVQVTATTLELVTNVGTNSLTLASYTALDDLITAINALGDWVPTQLADDAIVPSDLEVAPATDALLVANERYLRGTDSTLLVDAINSATDFMHRWCGRTDFASATYRRRLNGAGTEILILPDGPVTAVNYISIGSVGALRIRYTTTTVRRARAKVDGTNLTLVSEAGSTSSTDVALAGSDMDDVATLVNAVLGWTAEVLGTAGPWPATDLIRTEHQDALGVNLTLDVPDDPSSGYTVDQQSSIIRRIDDDSDWPTYRTGRYATPPRVHSGPVWPYGHGNLIVSYTAGYATLPSDVEQVCNELAANYVRGGRHDTAISAETTGGYSRAASGEGPFTVAMEVRLSQYRIPMRAEFMDV